LGMGSIAERLAKQALGSIALHAQAPSPATHCATQAVLGRIAKALG
jgi:hypothetical protein